MACRILDTVRIAINLELLVILRMKERIAEKSHDMKTQVWRDVAKTQLPPLAPAFLYLIPVVLILLNMREQATITTGRLIHEFRRFIKIMKIEQVVAVLLCLAMRKILVPARGTE